MLKYHHVVVINIFGTLSIFQTIEIVFFQNDGKIQIKIQSGCAFIVTGHHGIMYMYGKTK